MQIEVNQDKLTLIQEEQEVINSGAIDYYEVNITFDSSWDSLIKKVILISNNEQEGEEIAVINNRISIDVKHFGTYYIGIVGYTIIDDVKTKQISTNLESIYINQGAGSIECEEHEIPGPSEWDIYIAQIQAMCNQSYTKNETDALLDAKVDKEEGKDLSSNDFTTEEKDKLESLENYDDTEIVQDIAELGTNKADRTEIPTTTNDLTNNSGFITNVVNDLLNYYLKSEIYTKQEVNTLIGNIVTVQIVPVDALPETGEANKIYLVPSSEPNTQNARDEYIWFNNEWELIGSTQIDLTGYATESWVNTQIADFLTSQEISTLITNSLINYYAKSETDTLLNNKVDKVENKGLSTNDYTTEEKTKLEGLENYDDTEIQAEIANKNDLFQVVNVPENPTSGDLVQYVGETNEDYVYGHFYKFVQGNPENAVGTTDSMTIYDITVDVSQFKRQIVMIEERDYTFSYYIDMGTSEGCWDFDMMPVDIADFGISYEGEPIEGDSITVTYNKATVSKWSEQEIQSGTQFNEMPIPSEKTYSKLIQYIGETYTDDMLLTPVTYTKGHFYETAIDGYSEQYIADPTVDENTVGTYYTRRGISRYIEVTLPDDYVAGTTYFVKVEVSDYIFKEVIVSPQTKRKYIDDMMTLEQTGEAPDITVTVYDNDVNDSTLVELYANNDDTFNWLAENMVNNMIDEYDGSFSFRVKQNLPSQYSMYYTITPIEVEEGMM